MLPVSLEVTLLTAGTVRHAKLQSDYSYQHLVLTGRMPFLSPNRQCQSITDCDVPNVGSLCVYWILYSNEFQNDVSQGLPCLSS